MDTYMTLRTISNSALNYTIRAKYCMIVTDDSPLECHIELF